MTWLTLRIRTPRVAVLASLMLLPATPACPQRVVRESASQWSNARLLTLRAQGHWCANADAPGCDFKNIESAVSLPDGGVIAAGAMGPIHRFGVDGKFVGSIGRKGQGPGEYGFVVALNQLPTGAFAWFDNMQMRIASLEADGKPGPVIRLMPPYTMANMWVIGLDLVVLDVPAAPVRGDTVDATYHTVPATGAPRILAHVRTPSTFLPNSDMRPAPGPFAHRVVSDVGIAGDVAHSNGAQFDVEVFPTNGAPWRLQIAAPARSVTQAEHDSATARVLKSFRVANVASLPSVVRPSIESQPSTFPPITAIRVLRDGTIWIRPIPRAGTNGARWDVFTRNGQRIGRAELPLTAEIRDGERNWILVLERGADDVPMLVRYRL